MYPSLWCFYHQFYDIASSKLFHFTKNSALSWLELIVCSGKGAWLDRYHSLGTTVAVDRFNFVIALVNIIINVTHLSI